jgi:hypothetical protein
VDYTQKSGFFPRDSITDSPPNISQVPKSNSIGDRTARCYWSSFLTSDHEHSRQGSPRARAIRPLDLPTIYTSLYRPSMSRMASSIMSSANNSSSGSSPAGKRTRTSKGKSSQGCLTCRDRHVKCDETKPVCDNCRKLGRLCVQRDGSSVNAAAQDDESNAPDAPHENAVSNLLLTIYARSKITLLCSSMEPQIAWQDSNYA